MGNMNTDDINLSVEVASVAPMKLGEANQYSIISPIGQVTLNSLADNIVRPISDASINLQIQTFTHLVKGNKEFKDANESGQQQLDVRAVNIGTPPKVDGVCQLDVSTFHQSEYHLSEVDPEECYLKDQRYVSDVGNKCDQQRGSPTQGSI